jgi:molecular chaperone Hsp33
MAVLPDDEGNVEYADGVLLERLPHHPEADFEALVARIDGDPRRLFDELALGLLAGERVDVVGDAELRFRCGCSREKVVAMIRSLGPTEITDMLAEQGNAEVSCHFCNEVYRVEGPELVAIRDALGSPLPEG